MEKQFKPNICPKCDNKQTQIFSCILKGEKKNRFATFLFLISLVALIFGTISMLVIYAEYGETPHDLMGISKDVQPIFKLNNIAKAVVPFSILTMLLSIAFKSVTPHSYESMLFAYCPNCGYQWEADCNICIESTEDSCTKIANHILNKTEKLSEKDNRKLL